jgi:hypothetical protein
MGDEQTTLEQALSQSAVTQALITLIALTFWCEIYGKCREQIRFNLFISRNPVDTTIYVI